MNFPHGTLTPNQIGEDFIHFTDFDVEFELGWDVFDQFQAKRDLLRANGGDLIFIYWPDGTAFEFKHLDRAKPIDVEFLVFMYRQIHLKAAAQNVSRAQS